MATSKVSVTEGAGKNLATHSISEDAVTKEVQRVVPSDSAGVEKGTAANPQQVSIANTGANATAVKVDGSAVTQPVSGTVTVQQSTASNLKAQIQVLDGSGNALATAKGTQGTSAVAMQSLKDAGRTPIALYLDRATGVTTEAIQTININKGGTLTTGTNYQVTAGKTFRITSLNCSVLNTTTVANRVLIRVMSDSATPTTASPNIAHCMAAAAAALAASGGYSDISYPDGIEIAGGLFVAISQICSVTTAGIVSCMLTGYEY